MSSSLSVFLIFDHGFDAVAEAFSLGLRPALMDLTEEGAGTVLYLMFQGYKRTGGDGSGALPDALRSTQAAGTWARDRRWSTGKTGTMLRLTIGTRCSTCLGRERWARRRWGFDYLHMALPISRVLDYRRRASELLTKQGVEVREYAIWGRPELFSMLVRPMSNRVDSVEFADTVDDVLRLAQDMGGTMEYCHGTGVKLAHLLAREWGVGLDVVRAMKQALDPGNIMNPGKLGL